MSRFLNRCTSLGHLATVLNQSKCSHTCCLGNSANLKEIIDGIRHGTDSEISEGSQGRCQTVVWVLWLPLQKSKVMDIDHFYSATSFSTDLSSSLDLSISTDLLRFLVLIRRLYRALKVSSAYRSISFTILSFSCSLIAGEMISIGDFSPILLKFVDVPMFLSLSNTFIGY